VEYELYVIGGGSTGLTWINSHLMNLLFFLLLNSTAARLSKQDAGFE